jgi:hypothetical protein
MENSRQNAVKRTVFEATADSDGLFNSIMSGLNSTMKLFRKADGDLRTSIQNTCVRVIFRDGHTIQVDHLGIDEFFTKHPGYGNLVMPKKQA